MEERNPGRISIRERVGCSLSRIQDDIGERVGNFLDRLPLPDLFNPRETSLKEIYERLEKMSVDPRATQEQRVDALRTLAHLKVSEAKGEPAFELFNE